MDTQPDTGGPPLRMVAVMRQMPGMDRLTVSSVIVLSPSRLARPAHFSSWPEHLSSWPEAALTTVAFCGDYLAADRLMGGRHTVCKIFQITEHLWFAGAGDYCQIVEVAAWLRAGSPADDKPTVDGDSDYLLIDKGKPYWLTVPYLRKVKINEKVAALGSGSMYALGAMAAGADARAAVKIASGLDPNTGKGITVIKVRP